MTTARSQKTNYALPLQGRTALVTGASKGIGVGIALELARQGANVIMGYSTESSAAKIEELKREITALPHKPRAYGLRGDVGAPDGPAQMVAELAREITWSDSGGFGLDILVNNAAVAPNVPVADTTPEFFDGVYSVNLRGPVALVHALLPYIHRPGGRGRIISISSIASRAGLPGLSAYGACKGGLEAATRAWATELGEHGTTANAVSLGPIDTRMSQAQPGGLLADLLAQTLLQNRFGTVEEVATTVAWLASPAASWITGQTICASGGLLYR
ncbi:3-oxoacyl-[acyl-carrier-protein] reductase [Gaeumannomyces tritici R3-111a-1]|uniref:3-oxoacyl-[acyl-carrier-protein] reductase n=1 Tax=Gaeumannomyces tritici (strain R3-111a-1) TaxID=644352 RepID=J3P2C9_GAET3|nr:3-oxoacyl-[acyl-carrier-protein] reductase [Gaeumannomyces tritici R3-111a-1]EJT73821.1 3-oxoacyl-[acyl-carrier-protein] reductase [Gaeumannomyces tritici R3-111a-1]